MLRDLKLVKTKEFNTVISILIVEDLTAVLFLVILGNASSGAELDFTEVGILVLQSLTFFVITLGFGLAVLAHLLGQSSAIGAFIMGMIIASSKYSEQITEKILPLRDFFGRYSLCQLECL